MSMKDPMNALERAYVGVARGPEGRPEFFRQLRESMLAFLMPFHPELDGIMQFGNGDTVALSAWEGPKGTFIPIFTSVDRAEQALKTVGAPDNQYSLAEMKGEWLFMLVACQQHGVVINPACGMAEFYLDLRAAKLLADGSILKPIAAGPQEHGRVIIVKPADYPTDFIQPLFRFLRGRAEVQAAWLFRREPAPDPANPYYVFGLLATGKIPALKHDFTIVAQSARVQGADFGVTLMDPNDPAMAKVMAKFPPFYAAPDFRAAAFP